MSTYGIDLGTTYSCIAKLDQNGNPEVIQNNLEGTYTLASAVFFEEDSNNTLYGESAKEYMETSPERLIQFAKRVIGKTEKYFDENPEEKTKFGKNAVVTPKGLVWEIDGTEYSPISISALILKKLKQMAEEQGENVTDVIITCPAYFGLEERNATRKAGELAGLNVLNLVNEPTAAAISYCYKEFHDNQVVVVYDLGGGTFDVTVLNMSIEKDEAGNDKHQMKILSSRGNDKLGGKDWDEILYKMMLDKFCDEVGMDASDLDADTRQSVRGKVEKSKKRLSESDTAKVRIKSDAGVVEVIITKEEFEAATSQLVAQTMDLLEVALKEAGNIDIEKVLLVGGSTNMPMIRNAVESRFPQQVQVFDPDRAVAKGAAVYASILVGDEEAVTNNSDINLDDNTNSNSADMDNASDQTNSNTGSVRLGEYIEVVDQTSRSFGPGVFVGDDYVVDNLIIMGDRMPATATKVYGTRAANQPRVELSVFESMTVEKQLVPCEDPMGNPQETNPEYLMNSLGKLVLELPPNTPANTKIEVTFMIDAAGIHVTAHNLSTGESNTIRIEYATSMTEAETEGEIAKLNCLTQIDD